MVRTKMKPKMQRAHVRTTAYGPTLGANGIPATFSKRPAIAPNETTFMTMTHGGNLPSTARRRRDCTNRNTVKIVAAAALHSLQMIVSGISRRFRSVGAKASAVTRRPPSM